VRSVGAGSRHLECLAVVEVTRDGPADCGDTSQHAVVVADAKTENHAEWRRVVAVVRGHKGLGVGLLERGHMQPGAAAHAITCAMTSSVSRVKMVQSQSRRAQPVAPACR